MSRPPSTETLVLEGDDLEVTLLPRIGARLHRIRAFGVDLLRTPARIDTHRDDPFFWGAYVMAPWCNRAPTGPRTVAGRVVELTANFDDGSAIHGLVAGAAWQRVGEFTLRIEVDHPGWPWPFSVEMEATLARRALRLRYRLDNRSDAPMPAGLGLHPWFRRPVELRLGARAVYRSNAESAVAPGPIRPPFDLTTRRSPAPDLDATWTALDEPAVELHWPEVGVTGRLVARTSAPAILVALASPADADAVAVEPQTHGPDPLRRLIRGEPDAPILLHPGGSVELDLRLEVALARNVR